MNFSQLLKKIEAGEPVAADELAELRRLDPDRTADELGRLRTELEQAKTANLSAEERLQRELEQSRAESEALRRDHSALLRRNRVAELARSSGCVDPDYLDFLAGRAEVDLDDAEASRRFVAEVAERNPHCFRAQLHAGTGGGAVGGAPAAPAAPAGDRIGGILNELAAAPDVR